MRTITKTWIAYPFNKLSARVVKTWHQVFPPKSSISKTTIINPYNPSDKELGQALIQRDNDACLYLVSKIAPKIEYHLMSCDTGASMELKEVIAEAMKRLFENISKKGFEFKGSPVKYTTEIAKNYILNELHKHEGKFKSEGPNKPPRPGTATVELPTPEDPKLAPMNPDPSEAAEEHTREQLKTFIGETFEQMTGDVCKELIEMRVVQGQTYEYMLKASTCSKNIDELKRQYKKCREKLKEQIWTTSQNEKNLDIKELLTQLTGRR